MGSRKMAAVNKSNRKIFPQSKPHMKTRNLAVKREMGTCQFLVPVTVLMSDFFKKMVDKAH